MDAVLQIFEPTKEATFNESDKTRRIATKDLNAHLKYFIIVYMAFLKMWI